MLAAGPAVTSDGMHCLSPSLRQDDTIPLGDRTFSARSASILAVIISLPVLGQEWPAVEPVTQSFEVNVAAGLVAFDLPIKSAAGSVLYRLSCRGGSVKALDELIDGGTINWVGPLMCVLSLGNGAPSEDSLLAEDASPPWHTRGQFTTSDLVGACGAYPEFGLNRHFRLRGFVLRLGVKDLELGLDGSTRRFTLAVSIYRDPTAKSAQAERPNYVQPRFGKCDVVREGRDPRMCRISTGPGIRSWAPCPKQ